MRVRAKLTTAALLLLPLGLGGWRFGSHIVNVGAIGGAIDYITETVISPLAQSGWTASGALYCPHGFYANANPGSAIVTNVDTTNLHVGDFIQDGDYDDGFPFGTTIAQIQTPSTGGQSNGAITLSNVGESDLSPNQRLLMIASTPSSTPQWTWDPAKTQNQPRNALATGGTALATTTTGVADGTAAITGVNNIYGAPTNPAAGQGWWVTSGNLSGPVQIASISGSAPNYSITLAVGGNANIISAGATTVTIQPNKPTILQYRTPTEGETAAAQFTGSISGTTLTVTSVTSGTICAPGVSGCATTTNPPLYYSGSGLAQGTYILSQLSGTPGGAGTYQVSDAQTLGSPGSPVTLETMGLYKTYQAWEGTSQNVGPFPYIGIAAYQDDDVFEVLPAIYAGNENVLGLVPQIGGLCGGVVINAGSDYITCSGSPYGTLETGDYLRGPGNQAHLVGYISGTAMTVTQIDISYPAQGEAVLGTGIASGTVITGCPGGNCSIYQVINPTTGPVLSATGSGSALPAGTYYAVFTYTLAGGETAASPETSITITAGQDIQWTSPSWDQQANGLNLYLGTSSGGEHLQNTSGPLAINSGNTIWTQSAALDTTSATPPSANTTGQYTLGCASGSSGGCTSQTVGSASAPVAITAQGNFPANQTSTILAVYPNGNANCPAPNTDLCIKVSRTPILSKAASDGWSFAAMRSLRNITVEGITQEINGVPTRPVISEDDGTGYPGDYQGQLTIGGATGIVTGTLVRNIDMESNGLAVGSTGYGGMAYLVYLQAGMTGTNTLEDMRIEGQLWGGLAGSSHDTMGIHTADVSPILSNVYDDPTLIDPVDELQGTLNLIGLTLDHNGGAAGPGHNIYIGNAPLLTVNLINSWDYAATYGHLLKSRAGTTNVIGSYLEGGDVMSGLYGLAFQGYIAPDPNRSCCSLLTVTNLSQGAFLTGQGLLGPGIPAKTQILYPIAGTGTPGGVAQYEVSNAMTIGSAGGPVAMTGDYTGTNYTSGPIVAESVDAEVTCGGAATIENTILTKGMAGPASNPFFVTYGPEAVGHHVETATTAETPLGSSTLTFASGAVPMNTGYGWAADITNPWAFPWGTPIASATASTVTLNLASSECGGGVCMPVKPGDVIVFYANCPFTPPATSLTVTNDDFVAFRASEEGAQGHSPFGFYSTTTNGRITLPGDPDWPLPGNNTWNISDNIIAGVCSSAGVNGGGQDTAGVSGNTSLYYDDFPWFGTMPVGMGSNVGDNVEAVLSPAELNESFVPSTLYGDSSDSGIIGTAAYLHAAAQGLTRSLAVIGAVD